MVSADTLRTASLFARFDGDALERIAGRFSEVDVPANQVLIEPRTAGAGLFLICDGTVEVEAHEIRRELGAGEIVGEISLVEGIRGFGEAVRDLAHRRLAELEHR